MPGMVERAAASDTYARAGGIRHRRKNMDDFAGLIRVCHGLQAWCAGGEHEVEPSAHDGFGDGVGCYKIVLSIEPLDRDSLAVHKAILRQRVDHPGHVVVKDRARGELKNRNAVDLPCGRRPTFVLPPVPVRNEKHRGGRDDEDDTQRKFPDR